MVVVRFCGGWRIVIGLGFFNWFCTQKSQNPIQTSNCHHHFCGHIPFGLGRIGCWSIRNSLRRQLIVISLYRASKRQFSKIFVKCGASAKNCWNPPVCVPQNLWIFRVFNGQEWANGRSRPKYYAYFEKYTEPQGLYSLFFSFSYPFQDYCWAGRRIPTAISFPKHKRELRPT